MNTKNQIKLPDDTEKIEYRYENGNTDNKIVTTIYYGCDCQWKIVWDDISQGMINEMYNICLCDEHDPTISFIEPRK